MTCIGHPLLRIEPFVQHYDWGSYDLLPNFLGSTPTGEPMAEAWFGTHPSGPSPVEGGRSLSEVTAEDQPGWFGPNTHDLSYLLKVLAIARPLSLQMHPTLADARIGFDEENRRGVPITDGARVFRDPNHKPELICALTTVDALCGFRVVSESIDFLGLLGGWIADRLIEALKADVPLRTLVARSLSDHR